MKDTKKHNLILDLDETIIHSVSSDEMKHMENKKHKSHKNLEKLEGLKSHDMDGQYTVIERPGLQSFLDFAFENFNVSVWTAASKEYALFIINEVILKGDGRQLDLVMWSDHCDISKKKFKNKRRIKDLQLIWDSDGAGSTYAQSNNLILDDNEDVFNGQEKNCVSMYPFQVDNDDFATDDFLNRLQPELLKYTEGSHDDAETINDVLDTN